MISSSTEMFFEVYQATVQWIVYGEKIEQKGQKVTAVIVVCEPIKYFFKNNLLSPFIIRLLTHSVIEEKLPIDT